MDRSPSTRTTPLHDLLCRAVSAERAHAAEAPFQLRSAAVHAASLGGPIGVAAGRVLERLRAAREDEALWTEGVAAALVRAGSALEHSGDTAGARALFELAAELRPSCAKTRLHAGRAARRSGQPEAALAHYTHAQSLDREGRVARLARIGTAMLSGTAERRLSEEIRSAVRAGDQEAAGVGLEARATLRCAGARCRDAIRDLCACALRYPDREDRARAAERVASLLLDANDLEAAREALLLAHEIGTAAQRAAARAQLRRLSVQLGDELGARRFGVTAAPDRAGDETVRRSAGTKVQEGASGSVPSETLPSSPAPSARGVSLPVIRDWRDAVERTAGAR